MFFPLVAVLVSLWPVAARADRVVSRASRWDAAHTTILTDVLVERDDGRRETVHVLGGVVDVRSTTSSGTKLRWRGSCVHITPDAAGTADIPGDQEFPIIDSCFATWQESTRSCGYLTFVMDTPDLGEVGLDGVNRIKFRDDTWCRPKVSGEDAECYDASAAAITTVFFRDQPGAADDGTILDADIELNAVNFAVSIHCETGCVTSGSGGHADLANTLTHEAGHLIGLDHTCWDGTGARPTDGDGNPVLACAPFSALPASVTDATMYPYQTDGETSKETLTQDDIDGFCTAYPLADDPKQCGRVDLGTGCCSVAGAAGRAGLGTGLLGALASLVLLRALRRRAPDRRSGSAARPTSDR